MPADIMITKELRDRLLAVSDADGDLEMSLTVIGPDVLPTRRIAPGCYLVAEDACGSAIYVVDDDFALVRLEPA